MRARRANQNIQSSLQIALNISYGLNHVHEANCKHGDMKPHNVSLTSEFDLFYNNKRRPRDAKHDIQSSLQMALIYQMDEIMSIKN